MYVMYDLQKKHSVIEKQVVTPLLHEQRPLSKGPPIYYVIIV